MRKNRAFEHGTVRCVKTPRFPLSQRQRDAAVRSPPLVARRRRKTCAMPLLSLVSPAIVRGPRRYVLPRTGEATLITGAVVSLTTGCGAGVSLDVVVPGALSVPQSPLPGA